MKNIVIVLALLTICINVEAQVLDTFDFNQYKEFDYEYKSFIIDPRINGDFRFRETDDKINYFLGISSHYYGIKNSRKIQKELSIRSNISYTDMESRSEKRLGLFARYQLKFRYYKSEKLFYEFNPILDFRKDFDDRDNNNSGSIKLQPGIGVGYGRIEIVNNVWLAQSILNTLHKYGTIKQDLSSFELLQFAEAITNLKNTRRKDSRHESIFEFQELSKYLLNNNLFDGPISLFHAALYDTYNYENFVQRTSGTRYTLQFNPNHRSTFDSHMYQNSYNIKLNFVRNKVLSRLFQFDLMIDLDFLLYNGKFNNFNEERVSEGSDYTQTIALDFGYFPNFRTNYNINVSASNNKQFLNIIDFNSNFTSSEFSLLLNFSGDYYISPELRLSSNLELVHRSSNEQDLNFNLRMSYFIR